VIAVFLYHAGFAWLPGGFLGVEIFFVLSGYLITSLLLTEWQQRGQVNLVAFWLRRVRRLFPALVFTVVGGLSFAVLFLPEEVARLRGDALAALVYASNWHLIFEQQSYFETVGRPSLFQHLWSLAIEGQFYLPWPLFVIIGMRLGKPRSVFVAALVGAAASTVLMGLLYQPGVDPSRPYYGADTRATGLLIGAAFALVCPPEREYGQVRRREALLFDAVALVALGQLLWLCFYVNAFQPFLYRGGLVAVALVTVVVIAVVVQAQTHLGALLGWGPLGWIGLRSYSIYLWHWPVLMVTRPQLDVTLDGAPLLALQIAATLGLAEFSYRFVEKPFRQGILKQSWQHLRTARGREYRRRVVAWAGAFGTAAALVIVLGIAVTGARPAAPPDYLAVESI
jgi:peptidoglycan/LPS O-acetylase OafA/YrhL